MAESISLDCEPCIVLSVLPYNDGRRVVRVLGETLGMVALWVTEGRGKNRQVGKWHPGAMLELRGVSRKGSEGLVRFKEARRTHIPIALFQDVRRSAVAFFLCELVAKLFPEEIAHPEVYTLFHQALTRVEDEDQVGWIHAEFMGQLIAMMGLTPANSTMTGADVLDLQSGEWKHAMGTAEDHLPPPLSHWFMSLTGNNRQFTATFSERKELIKGQLRYLGHQLGGLREIKSYEVLEQVFE
ncbi:MAG: hypothetical protein CMD33_06000 [Flavobacteriales bacterium]|nr:hypothetical protein [Flavobacteriales bacterium]|tara:strand:+ start:611 stop:1333 length:723 start_codon:yes stop_codon:yes gene_type:complete